MDLARYAIPLIPSGEAYSLALADGLNEETIPATNHQFYGILGKHGVFS